jgi:hypothetical protein
MKNIYIENDKEIKAICAGGNDEGLKYDLGVGLTIFNQRHGLNHDVKRAAEYKKYLGVTMSAEEMRVLVE